MGDVNPLDTPEEGSLHHSAWLRNQIPRAGVRPKKKQIGNAPPVQIAQSLNLEEIIKKVIMDIVSKYFGADLSSLANPVNARPAPLVGRAARRKAAKEKKKQELMSTWSCAPNDRPAQKPDTNETSQPQPPTNAVAPTQASTKEAQASAQAKTWADRIRNSKEEEDGWKTTAQWNPKADFMEATIVQYSEASDKIANAKPEAGTQKLVVYTMTEEEEEDLEVIAGATKLFHITRLKLAQYKIETCYYH